VLLPRNHSCESFQRFPLFQILTQSTREKPSSSLEALKHSCCNTFDRSAAERHPLSSFGTRDRGAEFIIGAAEVIALSLWLFSNCKDSSHLCRCQRLTTLSATHIRSICCQTPIALFWHARQRHGAHCWCGGGHRPLFVASLELQRQQPSASLPAFDPSQCDTHSIDLLLRHTHCPLLTRATEVRSSLLVRRRLQPSLCGFFRIAKTAAISIVASV